ncbi:hypothetical protein [Streptomyces sp. NPDC060194]|uniref:hypothetical protein n=1 Tax=Streptomyces sp. NPDC060194 TaxID=3347069 RepID=UPI003649816C
MSFPVTTNTSDERLEIRSAQVRRVPDGLRLLEYRAVSLDETGAYSFVSRQGDPGSVDLTTVHDFARKPVVLDAGESGDIYYVARLKVTGPVRGDLDDCALLYEQGGRPYRQTLGCTTTMRLASQTSPLDL